MLPKGSFATLANGFQFHYHDGGQGDVVLFLHGSGTGASGFTNFKKNIDFFQRNGFRTIVPDLPGYGFAKSSKAKKKDWGPLLGEYFQKRKALTAVIIFMDIRHPLKESDWDMIQLCRDFNVPFIPVLTKSDKLSNNKITNTVKLVKNKVHEADAIAVSSKDITGFDKLSKEILNFID